MRTIERDVAGAFIFSSDKKLLLGKNVKGGAYQGFWTVPGGVIEADETPLVAVIREIREETGIDLGDADIEPVNFDITDTTEKVLPSNEAVLVHLRITNFRVLLSRLASQVEVVTTSDWAEPKWFDVAELDGLALPRPAIVTLQHLGYLAAAPTID